MILGLSHVAFNTDNLEAAARRLAAFGYAQRFDEAALENHPAKQLMLARYQPKHHIRFLSTEGAMAIELLDHGGLVGAQASTLIPIFRSAAPVGDWISLDLTDLPIASDGLDTLRAILAEEVLAFFDPVLSLSLLWAPDRGLPSGLYACALPNESATHTATLLSTLRFRANSEGLWSLLTPIPTLQARLIPVMARKHSRWTNKSLLDAPGCPCIAFMARGTTRFTMPSALLENTVSFMLKVNNKNSRISLLQPLSGPIIELIDQQI